MTMALPIAPTPILRGKDADRFLALIEDGLKHPTRPVPTPDIDRFIRRLIDDMQPLDPEYSKVVDNHFFELGD